MDKESSKDIVIVDEDNNVCEVATLLANIIDERAGLGKSCEDICEMWIDYADVFKALDDIVIKTRLILEDICRKENGEQTMSDCKKGCK